MNTRICTDTDSPSDRAFMLALYEKYQHLMSTTARKYTSSQNDYQDVVQEALVRLIGKAALLRTLDSPALSYYIVTCVKHTAYNSDKRAGKEHHHSSYEEDCEELESKEPPLDELLQLAEHRKLLTEIWPKLSKNDRFLLEGKYILGYTDAELSAQLGCKPGSIRMKLTRARRKALHYLTQTGRCESL